MIGRRLSRTQEHIKCLFSSGGRHAGNGPECLLCPLSQFYQVRVRLVNEWPPLLQYYREGCFVVVVCFFN